MPGDELLGIVIRASGEADVGPAFPIEEAAADGSTYCVVRRRQSGAMSIAEFMSASDYFDMRVLQTAAAETVTEWQLFADFLGEGRDSPGARECRIASAQE